MSASSQRTIPYLIERVMWWKSFGHIIFAHKPLCERFHSNIITIGAFKVCRSCTCLSLGVLVFGVMHALYAGDAVYKYAFLGYAAVVAALSFPAIYDKLPRHCCDVLRGSLAGLILFPLALIFHGDYVLALSITAVFSMLYVVYKWRRAGLHRNICATCPEYAQEGLCSGFRPKYERMKQYESLVSAYLKK